MAAAETMQLFDLQNNRDKVMQELKDKGYSVIPDVLTSQECDVHIAAYRDWLGQFRAGEWPASDESLIMRYRIGHFKPTWEVRLSVKKVFETIWQTKKLLSSFDSVAISPPPETHPTMASFATPGYSWLHIDQSAPRQGLHCYQGAVYLEETSNTDYCFRVLQGSHHHIAEFYATFPEAAIRSVQQEDFCMLEEEQAQWYDQRGCPVTKVPVPKGGMVVWDSRLVHDNCKPERGRPHSDRWRFTNFVCMAPARWSSPANLAKKRYAYQHLRMTTHWPSQQVSYFGEQLPESAPTVPLPTSLPEAARSKEAQLLAGVVQYDFDDGSPNGPDWDPIWAKDQPNDNELAD